ncbi:MAG: hypothetical protein HDT37_00325 [Clostridiales bacterium]|nr:hypothetical protein [Clostridiales bacterium]
MNTSIPITELNYDERLFLLTYRHVLQNDYQFQDSNRDAENISIDHVQAQKIGYTLSRLKLLNTYCFTWNRRGPFSGKFQELLSGLDSKADLVARYYQENQETLKSLAELLPACLLAPLDRVGQVFSDYIRQNDNPADDLELLGSLLYIGTTVLPGRDFDQVNRELQIRKSSFGNEQQNLEAWNCLASVGLITA